MLSLKLRRERWLARFKVHTIFPVRGIISGEEKSFRFQRPYYLTYVRYIAEGKTSYYTRYYVTKKPVIHYKQDLKVRMGILYSSLICMK